MCDCKIFKNSSGIEMLSSGHRVLRCVDCNVGVVHLFGNRVVKIIKNP